MMEESNKRRIRKNDKVLVISGNSRGKVGNVLRIKEDKVIVQGVNVRKKTVKPTRTSKGGIIELEMPIHISNVRVCVGQDNTPVKLRVKRNTENQRVLYYKKDSEEVEYRTLSKQ
jgi:large subunit ribosomal protein L24